MAAEEIRVGDIGTVFVLIVKDVDVDGNDVIVDISQATTLEMYFEKPDKSVVTKTANLLGDGTDGKMKYVSITDDISVKGNWKRQGFVILPTGEWKTDIVKYKVYANLV